MAELLVRVTSKTNAREPDKDTKLVKRGDVVAVRPDGWGWGTVERESPDWRIVRVTNMTLDEAEALTAPEFPVDPADPSPTLHKRAFKLDIDNPAVPAAIAAFLADDTRAAPMFVYNGPIKAIRDLKVQKQSVPDPRVIGDNPLVIG